jgi:tetratricopeptide (TPR) repeat protein
MADDGKSAEINIDALKKRVDGIEQIPCRWYTMVLEKRRASLGRRVQSPDGLSQWKVLAILYTLLLFLLLVLCVIVTGVGTLVVAAGWWWEKLKKEPVAALVILLTLWGFVAAIDAGTSRVLSPETVLLISPFELSVTPPKVLPITGKTAASLLKDEVAEIVKKAKAEAGPSEAKESYGGKSQPGEPDKGTGPRLAGLGEHRKISADIEVEGISIEKIIALYDSIRVDERHVEGDVVFSDQAEKAEPELKLVNAAEREAPCRVTLQARMQEIGNWRTAPRRCDEKGLKEAAHELAEKMLGDFSPITLALYLQNEGRKDEALTLLRKLVARDPTNVRSLLDLAVALAHKEDYKGAIGEYREILKLHPRYPEQIHDGLGFALFRLGQSGEAQKEYRMAIQLNGSFSSPHVNLGYLLRNNEEPAEALEEFQRAVRITPEDADAHDGYGGALDDGYQVDEAIGEFREAVRLRPERWDYHVDLASELEKKGQLDAAITEYREFIRQKPREPWAHVNLAWVLKDNFEFDEAIQEIQVALGLKEKFAEAHAYLGAVYEARGDLEGAIKEYQEAIRLKTEELETPADDRAPFVTWAGWRLALIYRASGDYRKYQETFEKYIEACKECREANQAARQYADTLRFERDFQRAFSWYEFALRKKDRRDPETLGIEPDFYNAISRIVKVLQEKDRRDPDTFTGLGYAFDEIREETLAYQMFRRAQFLKNDENDEDVHVGLGGVFENAGLRPDAIREYRQAVKLRPDSADALRALANALEAEGEYDEARTVRVNAWANYKHTADRKPHDRDVHIDLGYTLVELGDYSAALEETNKAVAQRPWYCYAIAARGAALDGFHGEPGDIPEGIPYPSHQMRAINEYQEAITSKSNFGSARRNLADALDLYGRHEEAIQEYQEVLKDTPKDIWALTGLGVIYDDIGQFDLAIEEHQKAIAVSADLVHFVGEAFGFPEGHSNLCRALNHKGDYEAAIPECRRALDLNPHDNTAHLNLADVLIKKAENCKNCWRFWLRREAHREYGAAAKESEQALQLRPDAETSFVAGRAYAGMGYKQRAIGHYYNAVAWKAFFPRAHYYLSEALRATGYSYQADQELALAKQQDSYLVDHWH